MDRDALAAHLTRISLLLALTDDGPFAARAYENAARALLAREDVPELLEAGRIATVRGIGASLAKVIGELHATGRSALEEELGRQVPAGVLDLMQVRGLGPKKARTLWRTLGITSLGELEYAIRENRLAPLAGFGVKTQERVAEGLRFVRSAAGRWRLPEAEARAEAARAVLLANGRAAGVTRVEVAGTLRRRCEVAEEVVLVAACERPDRLPGIDATPGLPPVAVEPARPETLGNALLLATGSEAHVAALRARDAAALEAPAAAEEEIYARLGLAFVPPELREGRGEVERAASGAPFSLVADGDLKGLLHVHSTWSDGRATLREVCVRTRELGYEYVGITDHSVSAAYAGGLTEERVRAQWDEIAALRREMPDLAILRGIEADILPDGSIDYGDALLSEFDFVIASVHAAFHLPEAEQTARLVRAVRNPAVGLLGHATGRLLLSREGFRVDLPAVLAAAGEAGCGVETNASPFRLDLDWRFGEEAQRAGVFTAIDPDAHALDGLRDTRFGIGVARKGGWPKDRVANALPAGEALRLLRRGRAA